jgi:SH3-like domain-containing protein
MNRFIFILCVALSLFPVWAQAQEASLDNLPLPRWAILAASEINLRTGPGKRYPIDWVLKKKGLPVEIRQEFEYWRLVYEPSGATGWVHRSMLSSTRNVTINTDTQNLFTQPSEDAPVVAQLQKGVIARAESCTPNWCQLKVENFSGWVPKKILWGIYPQEVFE